MENVEGKVFVRGIVLSKYENLPADAVVLFWRENSKKQKGVQ